MGNLVQKVIQEQEDLTVHLVSKEKMERKERKETKVG
jgi:hypothetical protein